jgi:hypothetical protein
MEQGTTTIDGIWYARNMNFFSKERHWWWNYYKFGNN